VVCDGCGDVQRSGTTHFTCPVGSRFVDGARGAFGPKATTAVFSLWSSMCVMLQSSLQFQCLPCPAMTYTLFGGHSDGSPGNISGVVCQPCGAGADCSTGDGRVVAAKGYWGTGTCRACIVYSSTKGFVSSGGFTHVGFPLRTSVSPPTLYPSSLQLPLSPLSPLPSRRSRVPASAVVLCPARHPLHLPCGLRVAEPLSDRRYTTLVHHHPWLQGLRIVCHCTVGEVRVAVCMLSVKIVSACVRHCACTCGAEGGGSRGMCMRSPISSTSIVPDVVLGP
jgi:hypothetical protein